MAHEQEALEPNKPLRASLRRADTVTDSPQLRPRGEETAEEDEEVVEYLRI